MSPTLRPLRRPSSALVVAALLWSALLPPATARADAGRAPVGAEAVEDLLGDAEGALAERIEEAVAAAEAAVADAEEEVERVIAEGAQLEAELEDAEAEVEQAEAALATARAELDDVTAELDARRRRHARERDLLRGEIRESWKETTGGSPAAITGAIGIMDAAGTGRDVLRSLDVLRYVLDQRADEVKTLEELTEEAAALRDALTALEARRAGDVRTARRARDEAAAATERVRVLEVQAERTAAARTGLLDALKERGAEALEDSATIDAALATLDSALVATGRGPAPAELIAYGNGRIPADVLEGIGVDGHRLWAPAAAAFAELLEAAEADDVRIAVTDSYRSYELQVDVARRKGLYSEGGLAARPGTSNHGWGLAVDLDLNDAALQWMRGNAADHGFVEDTPREPWHWVFTPDEAR